VKISLVQYFHKNVHVLYCFCCGIDRDVEIKCQAILIFSNVNTLLEISKPAVRNTKLRQNCSLVSEAMHGV